MIAAMEEPIQKGSRPIVVHLPLTAMVVRKPKQCVSAAVTERDLVGLNQVLAPQGVPIRSACRPPCVPGDVYTSAWRGTADGLLAGASQARGDRGRGVGGGGLKIALRVGPPGGTLREDPTGETRHKSRLCCTFSASSDRLAPGLLCALT